MSFVVGDVFIDQTMESQSSSPMLSHSEEVNLPKVNLKQSHINQIIEKLSQKKDSQDSLQIIVNDEFTTMLRYNQLSPLQMNLIKQYLETGKCNEFLQVSQINSIFNEYQQVVFSEFQTYLKQQKPEVKDQINQQVMRFKINRTKKHKKKRKVKLKTLKIKKPQPSHKLMLDARMQKVLKFVTKKRQANHQVSK